MTNRDAILADISESLNTNYVGLSSFTVLIWDHIDTFADEVEYIWKQDKGWIGYLFFLNRYLTPLGFILNLFAYLSPLMTEDRCAHFVRFEGSMTFIGLHVVSAMMFIRVRALYTPRKWPLYILGVLFTTQFVMYAWLMTMGQRVVHVEGSGVHACTMIFPPEYSVVASSTAWLPLLYDTTVFGLTFYRTVSTIRLGGRSKLVRRILEDGIIYYSVIFSINLVLTLMIVFAPPGLKNITAQTELLMTVAMMSRITINLKRSAHKMYQVTVIDTMPHQGRSGNRRLVGYDEIDGQRLTSTSEQDRTAGAPTGGYLPSRLPHCRAPRHQPTCSRSRSLGPVVHITRTVISTDDDGLSFKRANESDEFND